VKIGCLSFIGAIAVAGLVNLVTGSLAAGLVVFWILFVSVLVLGIVAQVRNPYNK
jgi:hypothetical protein